MPEKLSFKEYKKRYAIICPVCGAYGVEWTPPTVGLINVYEDVYCPKCGARWQNRYELKEFTIQS